MKMPAEYRNLFLLQQARLQEQNLLVSPCDAPYVFASCVKYRTAESLERMVDGRWVDGIGLRAGSSCFFVRTGKKGKVEGI